MTISNLTSADEFRPLYVEVEQLTDTRYVINVKIPPRIPMSNHPEIRFPEHCSSLSPRLTAETLTMNKRRSGTVYQCNQSIAGESLTIHYPSSDIPNSSVVKMLFLSGENHTVVLPSGVRQWQVPETEDIASVAKQYTWLGIEHIWAGFDHLLFLLCLIWIAGSWQRILLTVTGFTLAHSVTLVLSALDIIRLAVPPVEAVIALSVLFLATEVTKGKRDNLTWRNPIAVSSSFGLLHGLGFAAVLSEIGLPQTEVLSGLLFFNVGVEIGQALFALLVVGIIHLARVTHGITAFNKWGQQTMGYVVGITAAYWLIQRIIGFAV